MGKCWPKIMGTILDRASDATRPMGDLMGLMRRTGLDEVVLVAQFEDLLSSSMVKGILGGEALLRF